MGCRAVKPGRGLVLRQVKREAESISGQPSGLPGDSVRRRVMNTRIRAQNPAALLRERLEALVAQLAELEKLRDRVGREENRQRKLRKADSPPCRARTAGSRSSFAQAKLMPVLLGFNKLRCCSERPKANG